MSTPAVCRMCSEELEEGVAFCTNCGTPVDPATDDADDGDDWSEVPPAVEAAAIARRAPAPSAPANDDLIIRRTRRSPLLPPPEVGEDEDDVVISREWATATRNRDVPNQVGHARKIAGDLPAWEPLPPGEAVVKRRRTARK